MTKGKLSGKKILGFILLGMGILSCMVFLLLSFSDFPDKAATVILVLITGEVLFIISLALLGEGYWKSIRQSIMQFFTLKKGNK
ncbi:transporter suffix domain-containing protein [Chryseobacterium sp.]|uniref:transporter suffix domain-containing protein n=1 Tax=Chryseobacterium sp. TaxID=1871047 RepID=UPI0033405342